MTNRSVNGTWIDAPTELPPKDGTWVEARIRRTLHPVALQFDIKLQRWFNGKSHAVAERDITSWFKVEQEEKV